MTIDLISNMLSSLQNASMAGKRVVETKHSKEVESIAQVLKKTGFLSEVKLFKPEKQSYKMIHLEISEKDGVLALTAVKRCSKPGRRLYKGYKQLPMIAGGMGVCVVSTPKGIMAAGDAKKKKLGGEVLCEVL